MEKGGRKGIAKAQHERPEENKKGTSILDLYQKREDASSRYGSQRMGITYFNWHGEGVLENSNRTHNQSLTRQKKTGAGNFEEESL